MESLNWNTTSVFIENIGGDIDFVFIDTAHLMSGEVLNVIEILPFLKENAIIAFDDVNHQSAACLAKIPYFYSYNHLLFLTLKGKKILYNSILAKLGAVILESNQKKYYFDYYIIGHICQIILN